MVKGSQTGGVKPMSITGRFKSERERLMGMTDQERAFRKQWLKDQQLTECEPKFVPEMYKATHNPIRRAYRWPLNQLGEMLEPIVGKERASTIRYLSGKMFLGIAGVYIITYYFKYNANDWTRTNGWRVIQNRESVLEGDPGYPQLSDRSAPHDYADRGFNNNTLKL